MTEYAPGKDLSSALPLSERWFDLRMISTVRVILAFSALLVIYIDPFEPDRLVVATYLTPGLSQLLESPASAHGQALFE